MANDAPKTIADYSATLADIAQRAELIRATFKKDLIAPVVHDGTTLIGLGDISLLYTAIERLAELAKFAQMEIESNT